MNTERIDHTTAPADYEELYRKYFSYVVALVRRNGIMNDASAEDVASEILLRFYERDFLSVFDPTRTFDYHGESRPARFKSFLSKFVLNYLRGHWDKQKRLSTFEPLLCDRPMAEAAGATWLDLHGESAEDHALDVIAAVDSVRNIELIRDHLKAIPRRSRFDQCDLLALFNAIVHQVLVEDRFSVTALREHFDVGPTAMHSWIWWLRENVANVLGRSLPAKRPCNRESTS